MSNSLRYREPSRSREEDLGVQLFVRTKLVNS